MKAGRVVALYCRERTQCSHWESNTSAFLHPHSHQHRLSLPLNYWYVYALLLLKKFCLSWLGKCQCLPLFPMLYCGKTKILFECLLISAIVYRNNYNNILYRYSPQKYKNIHIQLIHIWSNLLLRIDAIECSNHPLI